MTLDTIWVASREYEIQRGSDCSLQAPHFGSSLEPWTEEVAD
jgi:hypothetical protein